MNALQPTEFSYLLERFHACDDGVIRSIDIGFRFRSKPAQIIVVISVRDQQGVENEGWVNLHLQMRDVEEFSFVEPPHITNQIISNGVHIGFYDELFFVDLGELTFGPQSAEEYRSSSFYAASRFLSWEVLPYQE